MPRKATDEQLIDAYGRLGSVFKVAPLFGMCGQSVHERLVRLGKINPKNVITHAEDAQLILQYEAHAANGALDVLAGRMGRMKTTLARRARELGLTNKARKKPYLAEISSINAKKWHAKNPHPRGMLGKQHTEEFKDAQSERSTKFWHSLPKSRQIEWNSRQKKSWKAGWRIVGGRRNYYRSRWEANYARYLEWLRARGEIAEWKHEPKTFWFQSIKRGHRSYLPDFCVTENAGGIAYHEVKGWMDAGSKTKLRRMAKYYPEVKLLLIDATSYKSIAKVVSRMIVGWE